MISINSTQVSSSRPWAEEILVYKSFLSLICSEQLQVDTEEVGYAGEISPRRLEDLRSKYYINLL